MAEKKLADLDENEFESLIIADNERAQRSLFWMAALLGINFTVLCKDILELYHGEDIEFLYLKGSIIVVGLVTVAFLIILWRSETRLIPEDHGREKVVLYYKISVINKQARLVAGFFGAYALLFISSYLFSTYSDLIAVEHMLEVTTMGMRLMLFLAVIIMIKYLWRRWWLNYEISALN